MEVIPYDFSGKTVRILTDDKGDFWWIASEVCCVLGLSNVTMALLALDSDEKSINKTDVGNKSRRLINEPGLYSLIIRSNKKRAKKFKRWITHDILPTIRKAGSYSIKSLVPKNYKEAVKHLLAQIEKTEKVETANKKLLPKADALDQIANCEGLVSFTKAGKILGIKPHHLIKLLELHKVLYRTKDDRRDLLPYQYFVNYKWFEVKSVGPEKKYTQTLVTQFGLTKLGTRFSRFFEKEK